MGQTLNRAGLTVGEIVARIDVPLCAGARMRGVENAIEHGVAKIDVTGGHIDLRSQHPCPVRELASAHATKELEIFLNAPVAEWAVRPRLAQRTASEAHFLLRLIVDISLSRT